MDPQTVSPETTEERVVWWALLATYPLFLMGALYVLAPVMAWLLFMLVVKRFAMPLPDQSRLTVPLPVWIWMVGMLTMEIALLAGHLDFLLGTPQTVKSSIGWAKGWALLALFPLIGCLHIRPVVLYRAACIVCLHTLLLLPVFIMAWLVGWPKTLYVSPLQVIGGPGPEFFAVSLYEIDPGSGLPRWRMFTPWAPALGFIGNLYFLFACREQHRGWRTAGMAGSLAMILLSQSRLAIVALLFIGLVNYFLPRIARPGTLFLGAVASSIAGLVGVWLVQQVDTVVTAFVEARADSSRVRGALARIALQRWQSEAPVWGHGVVERGPHLVEYMPIGSHHSWLGLLFVKGIVGLLALAIPMFCSALDLLLRVGHCELARSGFAIVLLLFLYTFGENLEILAYLFWPGLIVLGAAHNAPIQARLNVQSSQFTLKNQGNVSCQT